MAAVCAAMCFLAVVALEAAAGAARVAEAWTDGLSGAATVRVPAPDGREAAEPVALAAEAALAATEGVVSARLLSVEDMAALTAPWLGPEAADLLGDAPAPLLIDVALRRPPPDPAQVQARLNAAAPGAVYDDHAAWRAPLADAATAFRRLAFWCVGLMGAALAAMVALAARASLSGAASTVRTLRLNGARDGFIAAAFERPIALRALVGGAVGAAAAVLALSAAPALGLADALGAPAAAFAPPGRDLPGLAALALTPVAAAALAFATARMAILAMLARVE